MLKRIFSTLLACTMITCALPGTSATAEEEPIRITLDPGHGEGKSADGSTSTGTDAAVQWGGVNELYYNLTISLYTRERLEQYNGVVVNMTRTTNEECPGLQERVDIAKAFNSDAIISIHNNMNSNPEAYGSQIYVPNRNYNAKMASNSLRCANRIMKHLNNDAGTHKNTDPYSTDHATEKYPDGTAADHLRVIRFGKLAELDVAMIVECAFLSNQSDYERHISTDEGLKKLGYAIADGIADFYGLTEMGEEVTDTTAQITEAVTEEITEIETEQTGSNFASGDENDTASEAEQTENDDRGEKKNKSWLLPSVIALIAVAAVATATAVFIKRKKK